MKPVDLLARMVAIRSISGEEGPLADEMAGILAEHDIEAVRTGNNVWASIGEGGPTLLLNSHLDTVPPAPGWEGDPWTPQIEDGCLVGLGSHDAKGSVASMLLAFLGTPPEVLRGGRLIWTATCQEETGGEGLEVLIHDLPAPDAGVVGEPTGLVPASSQRGMMRLRMRARGRAAHASRPHQGENAIDRAGRAIVALQAIERGPIDPLLGPATIQVTRIEGGTAANVLPAECIATIDSRTTPRVPGEEILRRIDSIDEVEWEVVSNRFPPVETPTDATIVQSALAASGADAPRGFLGISDRRWLEEIPAVILGPGDGTWSHQANERLPVAELERAVEVYRELIRQYFAMATTSLPNSSGRGRPR